MTYPDLLQGTVKDPNEYLNPKVASTDRFIFSWMIKSWSNYMYWKVAMKPVQNLDRINPITGLPFVEFVPALELTG